MGQLWARNANNKFISISQPCHKTTEKNKQNTNKKCKKLA